MNTHAEYRRHSYRPPEPPPAPEQVANELAHHRDPSLAANGAAPASAKGVAWVRPTELASYVGPMVGRGIDLQAELIRRARRTPTTATRALRRPAPSAGGPAAPAQEGLGL